MYKIQHAIPQQNFEIIRDRIAQVLYEEIAHQFTITQDDDLNIKAVHIERRRALDKAEVPCINVALTNSKFDIKTGTSIQGTYSFYINIYVKAKTKFLVDGDYRAVLQAQKLSGVAQNILHHPVYRQLGFPGNYIIRTNVTEVDMPTFDDDPANRTIENLCRVTMIFEVVCTENFIANNTVPVEQMGTQVKLYDTDKGYYYGAAPTGFNLAAHSGLLFITHNDEYLITQN